MQKKLIRRYVTTHLYDIDGRTIEDVIQDLKEIQSIGCTHVETETYGDYTNFKFYYFNEETDEEFEKRIKKETDTLKRIEDHHYQVYLKLKEKYEKNN